MSLSIVTDGYASLATATVELAAVVPDPIALVDQVSELAAVVLTGEARAPLTVTLTADDPTIASVPPSVIVPVGHAWAQFTVSPLRPGGTVIRAVHGAVEKVAAVNIEPSALVIYYSPDVVGRARSLMPEGHGQNLRPTPRSAG